MTQIYTDGSAHYKTQYGAWAFIVVHPDGSTEEFVQSYEGVTNNKMELMAVLEAVDYLTRRVTAPEFSGRLECEIISDSEYVVNGVNEWRFAWRLKRWKNVKNLPLWLAIDAALDRIETLPIDLKVRWTRGHDGNKYNEMCDKLAHGAYLRLTESKEKKT